MNTTMMNFIFGDELKVLQKITILYKELILKMH
jgi:hypothetical protein